jgi:hypothetical protein
MHISNFKKIASIQSLLSYIKNVTAASKLRQSNAKKNEFFVQNEKHKQLRYRYLNEILLCLRKQNKKFIQTITSDFVCFNVCFQ